MLVDAPDRESKQALERRLSRAEKALTSALEVILALNAQLRALGAGADLSAASMKTFGGTIVYRANQISRHTQIAKQALRRG